MRTDPDPLVADVLARIGTTVTNLGDTAIEVRVVVQPASPLNLNVAGRFNAAEWDCTTPPLLPPYPALECTGPVLEPRDRTTLATWSWLDLLDGGEEVVIELYAGDEVEAVDAAALPVLPMDERSSATTPSPNSPPTVPPGLEPRRALPLVRAKPATGR